MSTVSRTAASTINTVLGTVQSTALAAAKIIDSAASGVDILDKYVQRAKSRQNDTHLVEDEHWRKNLILDAGMAQEKIESDIERQYAANPQGAARFNSIVKDLEKLFEKPETRP